MAKAPKVQRTNTIPSDPAERKRLQGFLQEASDNLTIAAAHRDALKEIKQGALDEFPITGKLLNQLIRFHHNQNFEKVSGEMEEIFHAYENLQTSTKSNP